MIAGVKYRIGQLQQRAGFAARSAGNYAKLIARSGNHRPQFAAVTVGRNDDYMPDFRERLLATVSWNIKYLVSEFIFVEWNPPADRELLAIELAKRFDCLRAYVVPSQIHDQICQNSNVKLLEYHAKNVGIRRARSPWIISTNADAAIGLDSVNTLLNTELRPDVLWTAERWDIPWRENVQTEIGFWGSLRYRRVNPYVELGTGEFCLAHRELWHRARGFDEQMVRHRFGCDIRGTAQMVALGGRIRRVGTVLHLTHPTSCTEGIQPHHGDTATPEGVPYHNPDDWGLANLKEVEIAERVWRLE
ncbi:MAG TPA: hypothetical protein VGW58_09840 [Pyrinomonadaceae bacterium]|nr:hypothetical protein [Pyrinomonadaceae bacterium]